MKVGMRSFWPAIWTPFVQFDKLLFNTNILSLFISGIQAASLYFWSSRFAKGAHDSHLANLYGLDDNNQAEYRSHSETMPATRREIDTNYFTHTVQRLRVGSASKVLALYVWLVWLSPPILAATIPNLEDSLLSTAYRSTRSSGMSQNSASKFADTNVLKFIAGCVFCTILAIGAAYWRRMWKLLAPVMSVSSVTFAILQEGNTAGTDGLSMMALAVWAIGTTAYIWTAKHRMPTGRYSLYLLSFTLATGTCTYIFAARLQERAFIALPPCAAGSAYVCKWFLELHCIRHDGTQESSSGLDTLASDTNLVGGTIPYE